MWLGCGLKDWDTGEQGLNLYSPCLALPRLCKPQDPIPEACPLSHGGPQQVPPGAWASHNSRSPWADPALYQGRRSCAIWPCSCPGGLTFPAPFQETLALPCPSPKPWPACLPAAPWSQPPSEAARERPRPDWGLSATPPWPLGLWGRGEGACFSGTSCPHLHTKGCSGQRESSEFIVGSRVVTTWANRSQMEAPHFQPV